MSARSYNASKSPFSESIVLENSKINETGFSPLWYQREIGPSICIPVSTRSAAWKRLLEGFEVLVVDDGGSSRPRADHPANASIPLVQLDVNQGPAAARNFGAIHARGRFLAFIDDDCVPSRSWLSSLFRVMSENPRVAAGGA